MSDRTRTRIGGRGRRRFIVVVAGLAVAASPAMLAFATPASAESLQACEVLYQPGGVTNQGTSASFLADVLQPLGQTVSTVSAPIEVSNCPPPQGS